MTHVATLSIPLTTVDGPARGQHLGMSEGMVNGAKFAVTLTEKELHIAFADRDGPTFAVDMQGLLRAAVDAIEEQMTGKRRMLG